MEERLLRVEGKIDSIIEKLAEAESNKEKIAELSEKLADAEKEIRWQKAELLNREDTIKNLEGEKKRLEKKVDELDYWCRSRTFF